MAFTISNLFLAAGSGVMPILNSIGFGSALHIRKPTLTVHRFQSRFLSFMC